MAEFFFRFFLFAERFSCAKPPPKIFVNLQNRTIPVENNITIVPTDFALLVMRAVSLMTACAFLSSGPLPCLGCPNKCSKNGDCNSLGMCECSNGFTGGDCSIRTCPTGRAFSDVAELADTAHKNVVCSGRGACVKGNCVCDAGFTGTACERTKCKRNCSYHGQCVSLRNLSETTRNHESKLYTYDQWDADKFYGCICDLGYAGKLHMITRFFGARCWTLFHDSLTNQ